MAWGPIKFKITHFLLVGTTKVVIFSFFMFRFCGGVLDVIYIAATTFSFGAWYVLWDGMWLSLCGFDLSPLVVKLCCSKPHNSSKCVISFQFYGPFLWGSFR